MPQPTLITSVHNQRIGKVLALRKHRDRRSTGCFIAEGAREVTRAEAAGLVLRELYHARDLLPAFDVAALGDDRTQRFDVSADVLKKMAYRAEPEGVLAVFEQPRFTLDGIPARDDLLLIVAVGIAKPGNLGAIARTADAVGGHGVIVVDGVVDAFNPNAIRASTGAVFSLPCIDASFDAFTTWAADRNVACVVTFPDAEAVYTDADMTRPTAIVIGPEAEGLDPRWRTLADAPMHVAVRLPMASQRVDSLNAATTAAVVLFEAVRQRTT